MFGFTEEDDLFGAKPEPSKQNPHRGSADRTTSAGATDSRATANGTASKGTMSPQMRIRRFDKLFQFASDRIGLQPVLAKAPEQVRNTIWQQLFKLATRREQMEAVVELFPKWRDSRRQFTPIMSEEFIREQRTYQIHDSVLIKGRRLWRYVSVPELRTLRGTCLP